MLTTTADGLLDDGGRVFGPHEWGRMAVPLGDVGLDMANERADRVERAAADGLSGEDAEPGLDHVEPGRALRGEVKLDLGMLLKPDPHRRRRVRGRVVEHAVQGAAAVAAGHALDEAQEISPRVPRRAAPEHAAAGDLKDRVQAGEAIALIVVRLPRGQPRPQGKQRLRSTQRLDLRLLIQAQHHGVRRWIQIQPDDVVDFVLRGRVGRELERRDAMGLVRVARSPSRGSRGVL